jgi:hypothetical protein
MPQGLLRKETQTPTNKSAYLTKTRMDTQQVNQKVKGVVDIVFLIDATGSMQHCIDALKNNISAFIETLAVRSPNNETPIKHWRGKVVGFRDFKADKQCFLDNPFVEDSGPLKQQLSLLQAEGGGDEPESLLDALYRLATMGQTEKTAQSSDPYKWRYQRQATRVVVAFTDASYHEVMIEPSGGTVDEVINSIHANRIVLSLFAPEMECYDKLAAADKSEYHPIPYKTSSPQQALVDFTADQKNFKKTMEMLAKSISQSALTELL